LHTVLRLLVLIALITLPARALASPEGEALHKQALAAAEEGSYLKAKALWEKAYRHDNEPKYLFNLGLIAEESDKVLDALDYFERFLKEAPARAPYTALAPKARARVKALLQRVAVLEVVCESAGAEVFVDQIALGKGPLRQEVRLLQGQHLVVATLAGYHGETHTLQLYGGQRKQLSIVLKKIMPKVIRQKARMKYPMPRWVPWTILATGIVLTASGAVPMVYSSRAYDDYNASIDIFPPTGDLDLQKRGDALKGAGIGLFISGGLIAAGGLIALLLNRPRLVHERKATNTGQPRVHWLLPTARGSGLAWEF
jgi:tetratricopeptide (TPR) repeat protein